MTFLSAGSSWDWRRPMDVKAGDSLLPPPVSSAPSRSSTAPSEELQADSDCANRPSHIDRTQRTGTLSPQGIEPPSPRLTKSLLELARLRKKAGQHVLKSRRVPDDDSGVRTKLLVLSDPADNRF